jgi:TRAP-type uncharacterized transport system substrate-binding protein
MRRRYTCLLTALALLAAGARDVVAQGATEPQVLEGGAAARAARQARESYRESINENVLFLMGGQLGAAYIQLAHDISVVVNDGLNLRVLPVVGAAGVQNVHDVVFLRGIDLALTNVSTLNALRKSRELGPNLDRQVAYIAPLFPEEMQVLTVANVQAIEDLRGKKVGFNNKGSATALFAPRVFSALGIEVEAHFMSQPDAIQKMRAGEFQATVCICPKPVPAYTAVRAEDGFHFVDIPYAKALEEDYLPATMRKADYPSLLRDREKIETIAGSTVLITFNWPRGSSRYNRTMKFVDAFFSKFSELQKPPRHPLWKSVNISASLPGWQRFAGAEEWLARTKALQAAAVEAGFAEFLKRKVAQGIQVDAQDPEERERLFREFLEYWQTQRK